MDVGIVCGRCGGNLHIATCNDFRQSGHDWVLMTACMICRFVNWPETGCVDCKDAETSASGKERP